MENFTPEALQQQWRALARVDFSFYNQYTSKNYWQKAPHLEVVCNTLQELEKGNVKNLILTMPPRHGKSMSVSESFPSWFIGRNPHRKVILSSYGDELAKKFGKKNRNKMAEYGKELFDVELADDSSSMTNWSVQGYMGGMVSSGIGGGITGEGADLLIVDDPVKNQSEADSKIYRDKVWDEWNSTLITRLQPEGRKIVIATRWHEDDLIGRILKTEKDKWTLLNFPAECENEVDDLLHRNIGEPLWSEKGFDKEWLQEIKFTTPPRVWNALYQQHPSALEGNIFKRSMFTRFYNQLPNDLERIILSWDCAFKESNTSDFVVGQVWGQKGANLYLINQTRSRMDFPKTLQAFKYMCTLFPRASAKLIEDKANGQAIIDSLKREIAGIIAITPKESKEARAAATAYLWEAGNVLLPNPDTNKWVLDFIEEHINFPNTEHDDQVDAGSQALTYMASRGTFAVSNIHTGRQLESWD